LLLIARREGESLYIYPDEATDPNTPISEVFSRPIRVMVSELRSSQAALAIDAPKDLTVARDELLRGSSRG
jgi:sRNA-binding carbon storage regulator CsrA